MILRNIPTYNECIQILLSKSVPYPVISHLILTTQTAIRITQTLKAKHFLVNCDFVIAGAMLHDLGRCRSHKINHGIIGGQILREMAFPIELIRVVENHLFAGIAAHEAKDLNLPLKDYIPSTIEEKIVAYADNISKQKPNLTTKQVLSRFRRYLPETHPILVRVQDLHYYMETLLNDTERIG